jgi:hypothetical protein
MSKPGYAIVRVRFVTLGLGNTAHVMVRKTRTNSVRRPNLSFIDKYRTN